ncbi:TorD/DmsD family molecular chaperone [Rhodovibrionaceae bacterium A322]
MGDLKTAESPDNEGFGAAVAEEDQLRAGWYGLLAQFLTSPPSDELLAEIAQSVGDGSELGQAMIALAEAAAQTDAATVKQEYFDLFIGVGHGELVPYGSYYLTGFLHEKPLAKLRGDMAKLGIARQEGVSEPEDHIASLFEVMAGLIAGAFGGAPDLAKQKEFYDSHVGCWALRFFEDLEGAQEARFYKPVGTLGRLFLTIEGQAFQMAA